MHRNIGAPRGAGGTLSEEVNQPLIQDADYSIFAGIELTLAYDWPGCPDDTPYGPVTLGTTPVVRARACKRHRRAATGLPAGLEACGRAGSHCACETAVLCAES